MNNRPDPPPVSERVPTPSLVSETIILGFLTGALYVLAGAYQVGYEDRFGFRYFSLGLQDVVDFARKFALPFATAAATTFFTAFAGGALLKKRARNIDVSDLSCIIAPIFITIFIYIFELNSNKKFFTIIDSSTYILIAMYYFLDPRILSWVFRGIKLKTDDQFPWRPFRAIQMVIATAFTIVLSYDVGFYDAMTQRTFEKCPPSLGVDAVLVERTGDVSICALTDFKDRILYSKFYYFKIPDGGEAQNFTLVEFAPLRVGVAVAATSP
jgi:hypothetical protein